METGPAVQPSLSLGWRIFSTRPLSLIFILILAVALWLFSLSLLTFPLLAAYGHAVANSRREDFFIDLPNIVRTTGLFFGGLKIFFIQSWVLGLVGLLPALVLYLVPYAPLIGSGRRALVSGAVLQVLWVPSFFLLGAIVFHALPLLVQTNRGLASLRAALRLGWSRPWLTFARGFLLFYPLTGFFFHFFMVFTYPILAGWALARSGDPPEFFDSATVGREVTPGKVLLLLGVVGLLMILCYFLVTWWGATGFWIWLAVSFVVIFSIVSRL